MATPAISIAGRRVASDVPPLVIAQLGINGAEPLDHALSLVEGAARAGAHSVNLEAVGTGDFADLDAEMHRVVILRARRLGLTVMSSPTSERSVEVLERAGVDAYRIASGDLTWDQLIACSAATAKPILISTGMATIGETCHALETARSVGARDLALLHAVCAWPVPDTSANLRAIQTLAHECQVPVGLSDHGADTFALPLAVALGAALYERRLTLGDAAAATSSTPAELGEAIGHGRRAWTALGTGVKACLAVEAPNLVAGRRSLCAGRDLAAGTVLTPDDLIALPPASGYPPSLLWAICGLPVTRPLSRGTPITAEYLEPVRPIAEVA